MAFCIPKHLIENLKKSALAGNVDIKKLYEMSSEERRDFFAGHTNSELGRFINSKFEDAMVSKHKAAITEWAKSVFKPEAKGKVEYQSMTDKINELGKQGILDPASEKAFLADLVMDKLGVRVTPEEVREIGSRAKSIADAQERLGGEIGNPEKEQENIDFFLAKKSMDDYLLSLNPSNRLKVLTGTIGRGMMLFSVKSPILNIGSNLEVGFTEAFSRRLASNQWKGADPSLAKSFVGMANKIYQKTGYDISRMTSISDAGPSGARVLGDTVHSQGPGSVRKAGRIVEDIVFKQLMGAPDVAFSSIHFADSVNLNALKGAEGDAAKASEMMLDAMRLNPLTPEGEVLRAQGILDAQVATWTNETWASKVSLGIRKILNEVSGDARIGDYIMPFVKTPANVIATGLDYSGLGFPKAAIKIFNGWRTDTLRSPLVVRGVARDLVRAGLGTIGAFIIASLLRDDDFVGAYDPDRKQIEQLRNSSTNSIRVGGKWISTDWLGPLAIPVTAMMYSRKYGGTAGERVFQYAKGMASVVEKLPGVSDIADFVREKSGKKDQTLSEMTGEAQNYLYEQIWSRLVPSFISDIAKATDEKERVSGKGLEGVKAKIPGLRQTLDVRKNIFGEEITGEPAWSDILFGGRVKTDREDELSREISFVQKKSGKPINFTDWDKTSSSTIAQFRHRTDEGTFEAAKTEYGKALKANLEKLVSSDRFGKLTDEAKADSINGADSDAMGMVLKSFGFTYDKTGSEEPIKPIPMEGVEKRMEIHEMVASASDKPLPPESRARLIESLRGGIKRGFVGADEARAYLKKYDSAQKNASVVRKMVSYIGSKKLSGADLDSFIKKIQDKSYMDGKGMGTVSEANAKRISEEVGLSNEEKKPKKKWEPTESGLIGLILDYAKAYSVDPESAFKTMFTNEQLKDVRGDSVIMERLVDAKASGRIKTDRGYKNIKDVKLDHRIPLELGGDNSEENLWVVPNEEWKSFSPVENYLAKRLNSGAITETEAQDWIQDFKSGNVTFDELRNRVK